MKGLLFGLLMMYSVVNITAQHTAFVSFKSHFNEVKTPFVEYFGSLQMKKTEPLSALYTKWLFGNTRAGKLIYPVAFMKIYNDKWVSCFYVGDKESYQYIYVAVFSENGDLEDSLSVNPDSVFSMRGFSVDVFEGGGIYIIKYDFFRAPDYIFSGNSAEPGGGAEETREIISQNRILLNGKIEEGIPASELFVAQFFDALSKGDFEKAYSMQKVPDWGTFEQFSSAAAFGAITSAVSDDIHVVDEDEYSISVFSHTLYSDSVNWGIDAIQVFKLRKIYGGFYIESMKLLDFNKLMTYTCPDFMFSSLTLRNISDVDFDFYLTIISNEKMPDEWSHKAGYINGHAKFLTPDHAVYEGDCILHFYFMGRSKVEIQEINCSDHRHSDLNFGGTYQYKNLSL